MTRTILILGATSAIARGVAEAFAEQGYALYLASRDEEENQRIAADLGIRYGVAVQYGLFDVQDLASHPEFIRQVEQSCGPLAGVVLAVGYLGEQQRAIRECKETQAIIERNYMGPCSILNECANRLESQKEGFIIALSSVAGDRGRQSNYIYGSAKSGLSTYLQGLRNRLHSVGVRVITVKPGFVDSAMTFGKKGLFLVASPQEVGKKIVQSLDKSTDVVYLPWFWRYIMWIICAIPERFFKRLKL